MERGKKDGKQYIYIGEYKKDNKNGKISCRT